ncbi:MAG: hypothetical protein KAR11_02730 [Phycisphaerae bacterium]|nr:hypothetical protein [Phycisphaerae bacterium]
MISACEIVSKYSSRISGNGAVFVVPDMDEQRLCKAVSYYAPLAEGEEALAMLDMSISGSAKSGVVVTDRRIFLHRGYSLPWCFSLERVQAVAFLSKEDSKGGTICINGGPWVHAGEGKDEARLLAQMVCELASAVQSREITVRCDRPKTKARDEENEHPDLDRHRLLLRRSRIRYGLGVLAFLLIVCGLFAFGAYGNSRADEKGREALGLIWEETRSADTMSGYYQFILGLDAKRIPRLKDRKAWGCIMSSSVSNEYKSKAQQRIAEIARTDQKKFSQLLKRLQHWDEAERVVEILTTIQWRPATSEHRVHWEVARRQGDYLERNWNEAKAVLLADLATEEYEPIRNALYVFISMGRKDAVPELEETLRTKGGKVLAEAYLNCGHPQLAEKAKRWARENGYEVTRTGGSAPVVWGQWK